MADFSKMSDEEFLRAYQARKASQSESKAIQTAPAQNPTEAIRQNWMAQKAAEMSPMQAGLAGAGRWFSERLAGGAEMLGLGDPVERQKVQQMEAAGFAPMQEAHPLATMGGQMAAPLVTAGIPGGLLAQMGIGAGTEAIRYGADPLTAGAEGGLMSGLGYGAGGVIANIMKRGRRVGSAAKQRWAGSTPEGEVGRLAERSQELGMNVSPGNLQESLPLKQMEASIKANPAFSDIPEPMIQANQTKLNQLALESIGEAGEEVTGDKLAQAADRIGAVYDGIGQNVDAVPLRDLDALQLNASVDADRYFENYLKRFPSLEARSLSGQDYVKLRNIVNKDIRSAWRNNPGVAEDLQDFQRLLDEGLERAAPEQLPQLREAGEQWRNLKALEGGKTVTKGNVNPRSLDTQLRRLDKGGYLRGRNKSDYYDAVRISNQFSDVVGDSGTATRSYIGNLMQNPSIAASAVLARPFVRKYYQSGGNPLYAAALGVTPSPTAKAAGAAAGRGFTQADFEEMRRRGMGQGGGY